MKTTTETKEKNLLIGCIKRVNNNFWPRDLELFNHRDYCFWSNEGWLYRSIRRMHGKEFKKELEWQLYCIRYWRREEKKENWLESYYEFIFN